MKLKCHKNVRFCKFAKFWCFTVLSDLSFLQCCNIAVTDIKRSLSDIWFFELNYGMAKWVCSTVPVIIQFMSASITHERYLRMSVSDLFFIKSTGYNQHLKKGSSYLISDKYLLRWVVMILVTDERCWIKWHRSVQIPHIAFDSAISQVLCSVSHNLLYK